MTFLVVCHGQENVGRAESEGSYISKRVRQNILGYTSGGRESRTAAQKEQDKEIAKEAGLRAESWGGSRNFIPRFATESRLGEVLQLEQGSSYLNRNGEGESANLNRERAKG